MSNNKLFELIRKTLLLTCCDVVKRRKGGIYYADDAYFYRKQTPQQLADEIAFRLNGVAEIEIVDMGDCFRVWPNRSYIWVTFKIKGE